jgi:hypothetical protein
MRATAKAETAPPLSLAAMRPMNDGPRTTDYGPPRRGLSLVEVLISFFILLIGVVSVITLFPIGVQAVQTAVIDTRATITAMEAQSLVLGMQWPDDVYLTYPPHRGIGGGTPPNPPATGQSPSGGDPRGVDPGTTPPFAGTRPSNDVYPSGMTTVTAPMVNNVYATIMNADGTAPGFPASSTVPAGQRFHPMAGAGPGFPVFVDPQLANSQTFQFDPANAMASPFYKRVAIAGDQNLGGQLFRTMAPFTSNLNDLVVHSLAEVQYQLAGASGTLVTPSQRDQYIRQHFFGQDELHTEANMPTTPYNPNRLQGTPLPGWRYVRSADSANPTTPATLQPPGFNASSALDNQIFHTASRNDAYSWAFVVRNRSLQTQPANGPPQADGSATPAGLDCPDTTAHPVTGQRARHPYLVPKPGDFTNDNVSVLVFNKRSIGRGYHLVRGCLFSGCATMTLCWDPAIVTDAPAVRRGTWLMEATISSGLRDTTLGPPARPYPNEGPAALPETSYLMTQIPAAAPASGYVKYRHAVEFYRVASVEDAVLNQQDGQMYQVVNLEQQVTNFPITHALGDGRRLPDLLDEQNPTAPAPVTFDGLHAFPNVLPGTALRAGGGPAFAAADREYSAVWVPIVVMHNLQEVFTVRN